MAPPSPSASTVLLPFLGSRPRRGSLASINSRGGDIDKDILAQALDHIHTSASKSETLTSFHDFDGGSQRGGAKELVTSGVSSLYNRFKQSVGAGSPSTDLKPRPKSSDSRDSLESESVQSTTVTTTRTSTGQSRSTPATDAASISTTSLAASPVVASFTSNGSLPEPKPTDANGRLRSAERNAQDTEDPRVDVKDHVLNTDQGGDAQAPAPSQDDLELARGALVNDDHSESATQALARVLSHHEAHIGEKSQRLQAIHFAEDVEQAVDDNETRAGPVSAHHSAKPSVSFDGASTRQTTHTKDDTHAKQRPQMLHVGASHLPGFEPSRTSSMTSGGDVASSSSTQTMPPGSRMEPSPNINNGLQRQRSDLKPRPAQTQPVAHVPTHLKRRVISKEFWMKDVNAKDCFYCGQAFSTFRRKHHCRTCGQIFDAKCTSLVPGRPFGQPGTLRLCKPCEAMIYGSDDDSTVFSEDGDEVTRSPLARRATLGEDDLLGEMDGVSFSRSDTGAVTTPSIGIPTSRRNREAKRRSAVIEFDAQPTLARPSSSHSLISLGRRPRSSSHRRHHSRHQNLRGMRSSVDEKGPFRQEHTGDPEKKSALPAFHNDNIIDPDLAPYLSDEASEIDDQPNILTTMDYGVSPGERERLGNSGMVTHGVRKGRSRHGTNASLRGAKEDDALNAASKHLPKLSRKRNPSMSSINVRRPSPRRSRSNMLLRTVEGDMVDTTPSSPQPGPTGACSKVVRSSAMRGSDAPPVELNHASLEHVRKLLTQMLSDAEIDAGGAWEKALVPVLLQCTDDVEPDVQRGDDMDIRHYVKLKKVPGGKPGDTSYVSGIVFSKNVALKSMARSIRNPRIAIVTFAIEYARHQTHFMSLEPVIAQEREYLHNLVGRIAALRPQLLLVQRNVSGLALRMLEQAGITVAYNIKESVLAAVARVTQSTLIKSVDKLAMDPSHLGQCDSFEVKTFMSKGLRKTYVYLSGCEPDLGCTIVLRGGDTKTLRKIKRIAEFMCYVAYNLKLETALMRDEFVSIPSVAQNQLATHDEPHGTANSTIGPHWKSRDEATPSKYEALEEQTRSRILSASPFVVFMQPYLLTQLREQERKLATHKMLRDQYAAADEEGDVEKSSVSDHFELVQPAMVNAPASKDQPKAVREYLHAVHEAQFEKSMHTYDTQKRLWESFVAGSVKPFDPYSHQTVCVLHSIVSSITQAPCHGPEIVGIGFYAGYMHAPNDFEEDCTLGQYIDDMCASAGSTCKECGKKMFDHHRQYVHGYGQLSISVRRQQCRMRGYSNAILMWSSCRICRAETNVIAMSENTWKYSFAKYLELSFWSSHLHPRAGVCEHDIHKDFLRCFGFHDMVVKVQYDAVDIYDVVVPRSTITWKVENDLSVKNDQFSHFIARLTAFMDSVRRRLDSINVDTLDEKKVVEAHEKLDELRRRAEEDQQELLHKLEQKYAESRYYELIPLNRALRFMDVKAIAWDDAFNSFEHDYFPSENDIRKLATLQLRNMFLESQPSSGSVASDASDNEDGTEMISFKPKYLDSKVGSNELHSVKAHDVMSSTVEEQKVPNDESFSDGEKGTTISPAEDNTDNALTRKISARHEQEQAVARTEVKHLDLAVAARSTEEGVEEKPLTATDRIETPSRPLTSDGVPKEEPFALQPKPLSTGLLERIEQIRSTRNGGGAEQEEPESKIPRLADLQKQDASPNPSQPVPPLIRAQSQPAHGPKRSVDMTPETNLDAVVNGSTSQEMLPIDKRLAERLGVSRIASKVGKVTPSLIPRSVPSKSDESTSTSVSALAKHFEQMSREFEKERLKERRQRAMRSRQARANPLASSRPVVEVYRNATDAVGERNLEQAKQEQEAGSQYLPFRSKPEQTSATEDEGTAEEVQHQSESQEQARHEVPVARQMDSDETEGSDMDSLTHRSREISDPNSDSMSSTLVSPVTAQEMELHPELSIPEFRKNVWFKYLADFWSKRSASGWANLEYPLHGTEHVFEDSDIIVREDEPSSVVALSLACADYQVKVKEFRSHPSNKQAHRHVHSASQNSNTLADGDDQQKAIEASLLSDTGTHMKYSFAHGFVKASCKIFYAEAFDALRRRCGVSDRFVESLSRCMKFDSKGGKTKSLFLRTLDNRFIIKSLQEIELKAFTKFAPDYFAFMSYTLFHGVPSVIAKMFGLFQVIIKNPATGMDFSYYLLVMENLFYDSNPNRRFDLKGSMRNRKIESTGQPDEVLLDENLVETIFESPLFVREHARKLLQASVWNDTMWLCKQNVMDYSLMAGFDDERKELVVGIIDCIRTYTWDKKLESWIKDRGKNKPTITSPKDYRNRFRVSMMQYVLQAPNCWHQFQAQMVPPKTLHEREERDEGTEDTEAERERERSEARRSEDT